MPKMSKSHTSGKVPYGPEKYIVRKNLLCSAQWLQVLYKVAFVFHETFSYLHISLCTQHLTKAKVQTLRPWY